MKALGNFTFLLDTSIDSSNAGNFETELLQNIEAELKAQNENAGTGDAVKKDAAPTITLDAAELTYISSAGLRVLLKCKKQYGTIYVINASDNVYGIFDITGFTKILTVKRALRKVDLTNAEITGHGASSTVFAIDKDTVVKVYNKRIPLWKIEREAEKAKQAFLFGIPTIISFDIVDCGEYGYGLVFERIHTRGLSRILNADPSKFQEYTDRYLALLKKIHETKVDESFEDIKSLWHTWVDNLRSYFTEEEISLCHQLIAAVPDSDRMVHSDCHVNNIMEQNGELVFIDMPDIGRGHQIFDIGPLCFHMKYAEMASRQFADDALVLQHDMRLKLYERLMEEYLYDEDPERHAALKEIYDTFGAMRMGLIVAKHSQLEDDLKEKFIQTSRENFFHRAKNVLALMEKYL